MAQFNTIIHTQKILTYHGIYYWDMKIDYKTLVIRRYSLCLNNQFLLFCFYYFIGYTLP